MAAGTYEFQSEFAKKHQAKGRAEGVAEGQAKGEAKGLAEALFAVLQAGGLRVPDEMRARVFACTDVAQLDTWVRKTLTVTSADEVF